MGESDEFNDRMALLGLRLVYATIGPERFWELARQENYAGGLADLQTLKPLAPKGAALVL